MPRSLSQTAAVSDRSLGSIPLLPPAQMPATDAHIAAQWQPAIARSAQIYGYTLDSSYNYREIACPFAPQDLLLAYESASPNSAISRFTAVFPRREKSEIAGRYPTVQIIPILQFGVIPFVPASSNPHSIEVFNQAVTAAPVGRALLSDMQTGQDPLALRSLCYLAMIGVEPVALRSPSLDAATVHAPVPTLQFVEKGRTHQIISIRNSATTYQVWTLTFAPGGRLMTALREEHRVEPTTPVVLQAAAPTSPSASPVAANTAHTANIAPAANQTLPQPVVASQPASPAAPSPVAPPTAPTVVMSAPPKPAVPPVEPPSITPAQIAPAETTPTTEATSTPLKPEAPLNTAPPLATPTTEATAAPNQPMTSPTAAPPVGPPSIAPPATAPTAAMAASPQPVALPAASSSAAPTEAMTVTHQPEPPPSAAVVTSLPVVHRDLPEPPHRFIPDPPAPPSRIIPASALQSPPHLSQ